MKKMIVAALLGLLSVSSLAQGWFGRGRGCCPRPCPTAVCAQPCAPTCEPVCEPTPPTCHKTIMVPQTIQVPKVIEVPARRIVIAQPDICVRTPQPAKMIRIPQPPVPQPDIIKWECQPDVISYRKQAPIIRFECPAECDEGCGTCR